MSEAILSYRSALSIHGEERLIFLQNLLTNDINYINSTSLLYTLLLTPQGKILYDFFITEKDDYYLIDAPTLYLDDILKKFHLYKLRSNIKIQTHPDYGIIISDAPIEDGFADPRSNDLIFFRSFKEKAIFDNNIFESTSLLNSYHHHRFINKIPECSIDYYAQQYFTLELGMDKLNAISYTKGCYVGQEVTARTTYRGSIKKRLYTLKCSEEIAINDKLHSTEVVSENMSIGNVISIHGSLCLAMLNKEKVNASVEKGFKIWFNESELSVIS